MLPCQSLFIDDLQELVDRIALHARHHHPQWWKDARREAPTKVGKALRDDGLLLQALGAGLAAEHSGGVPPLALGSLSLTRRSEDVVLECLESPPRIMDIARQVRLPGHALLIYTICGALIGRSAAGRLFVEDLGEALMIPVALLRAISLTLPQRTLAA